MTDNIAPAEAQDALEAVTRARRQVADEIGLPRWYWWGMAGGWVVLGVVGDLGPWWLVSAATLAFGAGHSAIASRLLNGRQRTGNVRVSRSVAGRGTPFVVVGMLIVLVALTIGLALGLNADGAGHPATWAAVIVAAVVGFGGPEILATLRRWVRA